ncbi:unnamed protein product [Ilex paraguariensis]|uniref:GH16 domain-containing protein n=1 Tax=Ilex paraguariensis TaxID=185542 RepID=A0ABC8QWU3_9AQUA
MSNGDIFDKNHDELDSEFLGTSEAKIQTNVYGNGSTNVGRGERYGLWFDPSEDFHQYSILWTEIWIISKKSGKGKRPGKGGNRYWKNIDLGFKTP